MHLFAKTFIDELPLLKRENVRVVFLGDISALPEKTRDVFEYGLEECRSHTGMVLALAVNYGGRAEIVRAARTVASAVATGALAVEDIDEATFASGLYTSDLPDPELVIRTSGGDARSNYLLWQIAYSEFYITDTYWPDLTDGGLFAPSWGTSIAIVDLAGLAANPNNNAFLGRFNYGPELI